MNTNPKVRLLKAWQFYSKGAILEPTGMLRSWLVGNGFAEVVKPIPAVAHELVAVSTSSTQSAHELPALAKPRKRSRNG